jgi:hypothetical protein
MEKRKGTFSKIIEKGDYCRDTHEQRKDDDCCDGVWKMFVSKVVDSGGIVQPKLSIVRTQLWGQTTIHILYWELKDQQRHWQLFDIR